MVEHQLGFVQIVLEFCSIVFEEDKNRKQGSTGVDEWA